MTQRIKTERLLLRPIAMSDAQDVKRGVGDLEVSQWLTHAPHPYSLADATDFISRNEGLFPEVAVIEFQDRFAGLCGIRGEFGYWLAQDAWGNRIVAEAGAALLDFAFADPDRATIGSGYFLGNDRSRKVLERLGFSKLHIETVTPRSTGREVGVQKMILDRQTWEARR